MNIKWIFLLILIISIKVFAQEPVFDERKIVPDSLLVDSIMLKDGLYETSGFVKYFYIPEQGVIYSPGIHLTIYEYISDSIPDVLDGMYNNMLKLMPNDTSVILLNGDESELEEKYGYSLWNLPEDRLKSAIVMPDFIDNFTLKFRNTVFYNRKVVLLDSSTFSGLSSEFYTYIIKSGRGSIFKDRIPYDCKLLPDPIKHGYTLGLSINRKERVVIYWLIAW